MARRMGWGFDFPMRPNRHDHNRRAPRCHYHLHQGACVTAVERT